MSGLTGKRAREFTIELAVEFDSTVNRWKQSAHRVPETVGQVPPDFRYLTPVSASARPPIPPIFQFSLNGLAAFLKQSPNSRCGRRENRSQGRGSPHDVHEDHDAFRRSPHVLAFHTHDT